MPLTGTEKIQAIELDPSADLAQLQRLAALGTIASIIAHEFNNILTPILSYSQMALDRPDDAALQKLALRRAAEGAERAAAVSVAVLDFARSRVPDESLPSAIVSDCVQEVLLCLCRDLRKDGIDLKLSFHVERPCVAIRPIALQQILLNLILNAKAAIRGAGKVSIRTTRTTRLQVPSTASVGVLGPLCGEFVCIEIEDSGTGIEPDQLRNLWKVYVSASRPDGTRGTGLGLVLCRKLVEQAGGSIWVESALGRGTVFSIILPLIS